MVHLFLLVHVSMLQEQWWSFYWNDIFLIYP
jgi:hypothetical protein